MLLLYNNLLDTATLTASSEATGFPANNLKNPFRTKCWKTAGTVPGTAQLVVDFGSAQTVDAIALTGYDWATAPENSLLSSIVPTHGMPLPPWRP